MAPRRMLICIGASFLAVLISAVPLATNVTDIITSTEPQSNPDIVHSLHQRSPMDPVVPSGGGSSSGAAAAGSSSSSAPVAGGLEATLHSYDEKGRNYYMQIILADVERTNTMLNNEHGVTGDPKEWQAAHLPTSYLTNGWTESDMTAQLAQDQFTKNYGSTFKRMTVGQAEEGLVTSKKQHLRQPSTILWPKGPNRLIRMTQDKRYMAGLKQREDGGQPTRAYHDVIYNIRDGILILLGQSPASDTDTMKRNALQFNLIWGPDQIWFAQWRRQRDFPDVVTPQRPRLGRDYENFPPQLKLKTITKAQKVNDLQFIIVPDVGVIRRETQGHLLAIIMRCFSSVQSGMKVPGYGQYGSFFPAGSWCSNALLSIAPNSAVAELLARHRAGGYTSLSHKTIVGVHIYKLDEQPADGRANPTLMWQIADFKKSDVDCANAWSKIPFGKPLPLRAPSGAIASGSNKGKAPEVIPLECYPDIMRKWPSQPGPAPARPADAGLPFDPTKGNGGRGR